MKRVLALSLTAASLLTLAAPAARADFWSDLVRALPQCGCVQIDGYDRTRKQEAERAKEIEAAQFQARIAAFRAQSEWLKAKQIGIDALVASALAATMQRDQASEGSSREADRELLSVLEKVRAETVVEATPNEEASAVAAKEMIAFQRTLGALQAVEELAEQRGVSTRELIADGVSRGSDEEAHEVTASLAAAQFLAMKAKLHVVKLWAQAVKDWNPADAIESGTEN